MRWLLCILLAGCGYHLRGFAPRTLPPILIEEPKNESLHPTVAPLLYRELVDVLGQRKVVANRSFRLKATIREVSVRPGNGATIVDALPQAQKGEWYAYYPIQTDAFVTLRVGFELHPAAAQPFFFERTREQSVRVFDALGDQGAFAPSIQRSLVHRALKELLRDMVEGLRTDLEVSL